jgi:glycosyltransferase involved in cell wall biosynthesis
MTPTHLASHFSIVTPTLNRLPFLRLCCASVADQTGASFEHIVVDGGSQDGTVDFLRASASLRWLSEKDRGMYDAVNKGLSLATGDICAYLNSDEQYLPGTLAAVSEFFARNPHADMVYGDMLVTRPDGTLLMYRKSYPLRRAYLWASHLYVPSCATFWRRDVLHAGLRFDPTMKTIADWDLAIRALESGVRTAHLRRYLAVFTRTDNNLGDSPAALLEKAAAASRRPPWIRLVRPWINLARFAEKCLHGAYRESFPITYEIYTPGRPARTVFSAPAATPLWRQRRRTSE